jgi:hypothetical protein
MTEHRQDDDLPDSALPAHDEDVVEPRDPPRNVDISDPGDQFDQAVNPAGDQGKRSYSKRRD